ncbi:arsenate reductase (glutaredoxin) [Pandoraea pulmonicola]|uniref:Arsenate reductase n=1 Tax=Pandoraea pulmonicola TaxID=93221 RepID=A0AAJ4ZDB3_PANPU|nr:arsenate reductase (glutaredoxin) [Pandoraea pulmonicola]AJC20366.1 arsenate reductase (glutaredoxin) [Pandoraea pulmonicola]SUA91257.1 arsenate reductase [Pandoraea pulmonicola]
MITVYHNPRCSKSREALALVEGSPSVGGGDLQIIEYLKTPPTLADLKRLHKLLDVPVREMIRSNETEYTELGLNDPSLTDGELLAAIAKHPKLLQRPIVVNGDKAVIARPPALANDVL